MRIQNNVSALNALNNTTKNENALTRNIRKLSSGYRINSAADDAAGLAISEKMRSQIRGLGKAVQNANDGISAAETAEGSMQEVTNILQRMRELTVQATNSGTYEAGQVKNLNAEFEQLLDEIDRIADASAYNGTTISGETFSFMVDANGNVSNNITLKVNGFNTTSLSLNGETLMNGDAAKTASELNSVIEKIDDAIDSVTSTRADIGAVTNRLEYTVNNLTTMKENLTQAESRIRDVDMSAEYVEMTKNSVLNQASVAMLAQANSTTQNVLSLIQ